MSQPNRAKMTFLELVFPPISNQEAVWFKDQPAKEFMKQSDFYMIGGKAKSKFSSFSLNEEKMELEFDLFIGDDLKGKGFIEINRLESVTSFSGEKIGVSCNDDSIEISYQSGDDRLLIDRFTPENILWRRSRNHSGITGLNNYKELFVYDLLYVGIAKVGDSYERLIKKGHHKRLEILANEPQRYPGARVTDETFLFLFRIEPLFVSQFGQGDKIDLDFGYEHKKIVADTEKAFVNLLQPNYNVVKFKQYPKGGDGLYDSKLNRYSYSIGEFITFNTPHGAIKGGRDMNLGGFCNHADFISVDKESSKLFVSGVDFPVTDA